MNRFLPENDKDKFESRSFIVRIWMEEPGAQVYGSTWYGNITDVFSGDKLPVNRLNEITEFIKTRLRTSSGN